MNKSSRITALILSVGIVNALSLGGFIAVAWHRTPSWDWVTIALCYGISVAAQCLVAVANSVFGNPFDSGNL